jgi:hypothetical protein
VVVLNTTGNVVGAQIYGSYGSAAITRAPYPPPLTSLASALIVWDSITMWLARYYNPLVGLFLSPDSVQGNTLGMDLYVYVVGSHLQPQQIYPWTEFNFTPRVASGADVQVKSMYIYLSVSETLIQISKFTIFSTL